MAKKRIVFGIIGLALAGFIAAYALSPVFAARALVEDARAGDVAGLERRVDFPAVREDLKGQLRDRLRREAGTDDRLGSALGGLGMLLAPALIDGAVEAVVTPEAIAAIVRTAQAPTPREAARGEPPAVDTETPRRTEVLYSYRDLNTFGVRVFDPAAPDQSVDLVMGRHGLFDWRLTRVVLPQS